MFQWSNSWIPVTATPLYCFFGSLHYFQRSKKKAGFQVLTFLVWMGMYYCVRGGSNNLCLANSADRAVHCRAPFWHFHIICKANAKAGVCNNGTSVLFLLLCGIQALFNKEVWKRLQRRHRLRVPFSPWLPGLVDKEKQRQQCLQQITFLYAYTNTHNTKIKVLFKETFS